MTPIALTGQIILKNTNDAERDRAQHVENVLPILRTTAARVASDGTFNSDHIATLKQAGPLGLLVPEGYNRSKQAAFLLACARFSPMRWPRLVATKTAGSGDVAGAIQVKNFPNLSAAD